jgi:hypothetical protein
VIAGSTGKDGVLVAIQFLNEIAEHFFAVEQFPHAVVSVLGDLVPLLFVL